MGDSRGIIGNLDTCRSSPEIKPDGQPTQDIPSKEVNGGMTTRFSVAALKQIDGKRGGNNRQPLNRLTCGAKPSNLETLGGGLKHAKTSKPKTIQIPKTLMKKNRGNPTGKALFRNFVAKNTLEEQESIKPWWSYGALPQGVKAQPGIAISDKSIGDNFSPQKKSMLSHNIRGSNPSELLRDDSLQNVEINRIRKSVRLVPKNATESQSPSMANMPSTRVIQGIQSRRNSGKSDLLSPHGPSLSPKGSANKKSFSELAQINKGGSCSSLFDLVKILVEERRLSRQNLNPNVLTDIDVDVDVADNISRLQAALDTPVHQEETNCAHDGNGNVYFMPNHTLYRKPKKYNKDTDTLGHWLGDKKLPLPKRCKEDRGHKTERSKKGKSVGRKYVNPYIERSQFNWSTSYLDKSGQKSAGAKAGKSKGAL